MPTHYQVLGIPRTATDAEIKAAFKALAVKYHPDKNPHDPAAEEKFKEVNKAYQVLSDSYKRYQYDLSFEVRRRAPTRTAYEPFYYPPYARKGHSREKEYVYGWKYVKAQVAAFAFIFVVAGLVMGVKFLYDEYKVAEEVRLAEARQILFDSAQVHFNKGEYRQSLDIVLQMYQKNPAERTISEYHSKFMNSVLTMGERDYTQSNFESAIVNFKIVQDYQIIENPQIYRKLADSYLALGMYEETVAALTLLQQKDKENLKLNMQIGRIYFEHLKQPDQAKPFLDNARKRVKEIITNIYGRAAELVMVPEESPQIYFDVFFAHGKLYTELDLHEDAIKDLNWSVFLKPNLAEPFYLRGNNYLAIGNTYKACKNWRESAARQHISSQALLDQYCN